MSTASATPAATSEAAALIAANRRRRRIRRWIAIGTLPLTLAALLVVGKVLSMYAFAHQSITSYVIGDHAQSISSAQGQGFLNIFEPYKAPFNVGTGLAAAGDLDDARVTLGEALDLATGLEVCGVRINLAIVTEQLGDAAQADGDATGAAEYYAEALTITLETPEECDSPEAQEQSSDPERDMSDTLDELEDRLQEKQQGTPPPEEEPQEQPQEPEPSEGQLDELQDRLDQGAEDREQYQQGEDGEPGSGTDRPW
ncbi:MAG: tetratricopeptide repeat protein [Actinomycetota bacterium]